MRDNRRRYRALRDALPPWYPGQPPSTVARHVPTRAAFSSGIVGRKSTPLPSVATTSPEGTQPESRGKRWPRGLDNARLVEEGYCVPSVDRFLTPCALAALVVVMEGRVVGRGCLALLCHVISKGRAVPRAGRVRHRPTGPGPEALHLAVVALRSTVSPEGAKGVVLGDGECAGTAWQDTLRAGGWSDVCWTARRTTATWEGEALRLAA
jgi:hypothetical protein